jgi:hypothetical protein
LDLSSVPALLSYSLAGAHLIVTLISGFPVTAIKLIPFTIQGWVERIVGPVLIAAPFVFNFSSEILARNFYFAMGAIIIIVGLLTDYQGSNRSFNNSITDL